MLHEAMKKGKNLLETIKHEAFINFFNRAISTATVMIIMSILTYKTPLLFCMEAGRY